MILKRHFTAQKEKIRWLWKQLNLKYKDFVCILDDESYFTLTNSKINGNNNFYSSNVEFTPNEVKFKTKDKFENILIVYAIISSLGVSRPHITPSRIAINVNEPLLRKKWCCNTRKHSLYILSRPCGIS